MAAAKVVSLGHIARESSDIHRLAAFYKQILGFEQIKSPKFSCETIWLKLPPSYSLHLIERNPSAQLAESPYTATESSVKDPKFLPRGHHICFSVSNFDEFVLFLKEKGVETFEKTLPDGKTKQVFFFDPDGNGLEAASIPSQ